MSKILSDEEKADLERWHKILEDNVAELDIKRRLAYEGNTRADWVNYAEALEGYLHMFVGYVTSAIAAGNEDNVQD